MLSVLDSVFRRLGRERRRDLGWLHRSGTQSVGVSDVNGVGTSVGFGLGWSATWKQTSSAPRLVGASDANGIGALVGFCRRHRWSNGIVNGVRNSIGRSRGHERSRDVVNCVGQLTLGCGPNSVANGVGTSVGWSCGRGRRRDVGNSVGRLTSGRGSIGIRASVGMGSLGRAQRRAVGRVLFGDSVG